MKISMEDTMKSYDQIDEFLKLLLQVDKLLSDFLELSKKNQMML